MGDLSKVVLCAVVVLCFIEIGYGLSCLSCRSTNLTSACREGRRSKQPKLETCYGRRAKCFSAATVSDYGEALFQRGCSRIGACVEEEDEGDLEFCQTCQYKHCNYEYMELDKEVEDYLLGEDASDESSVDLPGEAVIPQESALVEKESSSDKDKPLIDDAKGETNIS